MAHWSGGSHHLRRGCRCRRAVIIVLVIADHATIGTVGIAARGSLGHQIGPVSCQLLQIFLFGILSALLVSRLVIGIQIVPHRSHVFGNLAKAGIGIPGLDPSLHVSEEQGIGRDRLLRLIGISLLLGPSGLTRPFLNQWDSATGVGVVVRVTW